MLRLLFLLLLVELLNIYVHYHFTLIFNRVPLNERIIVVQWCQVDRLMHQIANY